MLKYHLMVKRKMLHEIYLIMNIFGVSEKKDGIGKEKVRDIKLSCRGVLGEDWTSKAGLNIHCASFPIELPTWGITVYSDENDIVLDPFMGSGTTAIACINTGRKFIEFELDKQYFDIAQNRINKAKSAWLDDLLGGD